MLRITIMSILLLLTNSSIAVNLKEYTDAKQYWERTKDKPEYQSYLAEFIQFNNHFKLDSKDGCSALAEDPVEMMLIITHQDNSKFAVIERVFTSAQNAKARCYEKSYIGVPTKIPPYLPFVIQMNMQ
ncbi:MAG TPA: hypothetical protein VIM93_05845 [Kangiella sp.]